MAFWHRWVHKSINFIRFRQADQDLEREVTSHLRLMQDDFMQRGMSGEDAFWAAKRAYGSIEQAKELHRDERSWVWLEQLWQDIRFAARGLLKSPAFTMTAVLTLALGIGANTAIFSLIDSVMLRALPVNHPEQLLQVRRASVDVWGTDNPYLSNPVWEQLRDRQDVFSGIFAYSVGRFNLRPSGEAHFAQGNYVSGGFFETLGLRALLGRTLTPSDDRRGCAGTAVLSYGFWQSEYGGRAEALGKTISLDHHPFAIVGATGPGFSGVDVGRESDVYVPLCSEQIIHGEHSALDHATWIWLSVVGRPKAGVSEAQVDARLSTLASGIAKTTVPADLRPEQRKTYLNLAFGTSEAANGLSTIRGKYQKALTVVMAIAGVVLLIACANVANLLLARGTARQRELAIRIALGSGRRRLMRQLLTESLLLSLSGAVAGIGFAHWAARVLVGLLASNVYHEKEVFLDLSIDSTVLTFTVGIAVLTGLLFGLMPAWKAVRVEPQWAMKANARGIAEGGFWFGKALVAAQVALSFILLAGAGLMVETFVRLETMNPGFDSENVLLAEVTATGAQRREVFERIMERLRAMPGVRSASYSDVTPVDGSISASYAKVSDTAEPVLVYLNEVSDGYMATLGTRLLAGRDFNAHDTVSSPRVALVNQALARKFFGGRNPVGKQYRPMDGNQLGEPVEIVGLVQDAKYAELREESPATAYVAASQDTHTGESLTFEVRSGASVSAVKAAILDVNPNVSLQFRTLAGQLDESLARERLMATLSGFFGGLALLLAVIGLYGVTSYSVRRRRSEIGIRMALGARPSRVMRSVLGEVVILTGIGLAIGSAAATGLARFVASFLYGVRPTDPRNLGLAAGILAAAALLAGFLPARRAARMDPMNALREE